MPIMNLKFCTTKMNGWIKLHRQILDWEWYQNPNVMSVFLHCLLKANHKNKRWQGIEIQRGQFLTSYKKISEELSGRYGKISIMQVRTALHKLNLTGEITIKTTNKYTVIEIKNYDNYQEDNTQDNRQITNKQQTNNKQITTTKNEKNEKNEKNQESDFSKSLQPQIKTPSQITKDFFENKEQQKNLIDSLCKKQIPFQIAVEEINKFISYWTEPTKSGKKQRWELQKTFEISRRIANWFRNKIDWAKEKKELNKERPSIM